VGKKLYVGNLTYKVVDSDLEELFSQFGTVQSAQIIMDRETGRSKGFGFVEMDTEAQATAAIEGLHDHEYDGRRLTVNEARRLWRGRRPAVLIRPGRNREASSPGLLAHLAFSPPMACERPGEPDRGSLYLNEQGRRNEPEARPHARLRRGATKAVPGLPTSRLFAGRHPSAVRDEAV